MAETWTIWDAELGYSHTSLNAERREQPTHADGAEPLWGVAQVRPDGQSHLHVFPHSAMEWRAAEYSIDPDDLDTLLKVILHEPWIPDAGDPLLWQDPGAAAVVEATHGLPTCWTPGVPDSERLAAHLARIEAVKTHRVCLQPEAQQVRQDALAFVGSPRAAPTDPLDPIKSLTRLDPLRVQSRSMAVAWHREVLRQPLRPTFDQKPASTFVGMQPTGGTG